MEKRKVLVIDDEQIVLDSVRKILVAEDYDVDATLEGKEGIRSAIRNAYDAVLTDIRMPDVSGLVVLRDIKREKPALPVLIITGYASVQSAVQAMRLGASDYIEKPFEPQELILSLSAAIERGKTRVPDVQTIIHKEAVLSVLDRAAQDYEFRHRLLDNGVDALEEYKLTIPEKLALITGDIGWIEKQIGALSPDRKKWLEARVGAEIW